MNLTTITSRAAAALVAAVAGFASYQHIYDVASGAGEHVTVAAVLPLAIDGLILVATAAMLDDKRQQRQPRLSARVALLFGVVATLAANVASAEPTATARMVAAIPAVSFLLAVEVLARSGKPLAAPNPPPAPVVVPPLTTPPAAPDNATPPASEPATVAAPPVARSTPRRPAKRTPPKAATARQSTAERVANAVAMNPAMTQAQAAAELAIGIRTVQRYWPKPAAALNGHDHSKEAG